MQNVIKMKTVGRNGVQSVESAICRESLFVKQTFMGRFLMVPSFRRRCLRRRIVVCDTFAYWGYCYLRANFPCNMEENCVSLATGKTTQLTLKGCKGIEKASRLRQEDIKKVAEKQFVHENCRRIYCDQIKIERDFKKKGVLSQPRDLDKLQGSPFG